MLGSIHCGELSKKRYSGVGCPQRETCLQFPSGVGQVVSSGRKGLAEVRSRSLLGELSTMSLYEFSCRVDSQRKASIRGNQGLLKEDRKKKKSLAEIKGIV